MSAPALPAPAAGPVGPAYVPEIHDVAPDTWPAVRSLLALLPDEARPLTAMLVVPHWRGGRRIAEAPDVAAALAEHPGAKVLHGLTHTLGPRVWDALYYGTENEGEFAALGAAAAVERVTRARDLFAEAFGESPRWFCAPRWQMSAGAWAALATVGIPGCLLRDAVALGDRRSVRAEAIWFDDGRRASTRAVARLVRRRRIARLLRERRVVRLALHPRDLEDAATRDEIRTLVARLAHDGWRPLPLPALATA